MTGTVTEETIDELATEARRAEHGESRSLLLLGLNRLKSPAARQALEGFVEDPQLGQSVARLLS